MVVGARAPLSRTPDAVIVTGNAHAWGQEGDSRYYEVTVTVDDEAMHMTARGTVEDGRLVRVESVDPDVYTALVERSK